MSWESLKEAYDAYLGVSEIDLETDTVGHRYIHEPEQRLDDVSSEW